MIQQSNQWRRRGNLPQKRITGNTCRCYPLQEVGLESPLLEGRLDSVTGFQKVEYVRGRTPGGHHANQVMRVMSPVISHVAVTCPLMRTTEKGTSALGHSSPKPSPQTNHQKTSDKLKLMDIPGNTWPVLFNTAKVTKTKERQRKGHRLETLRPDPMWSPEPEEGHWYENWWDVGRDHNGATWIVPMSVLTNTVWLFFFLILWLYKKVTLGKAGQRVYQNSLFCLCNLSMNLKLF